MLSTFVFSMQFNKHTDYDSFIKVSIKPFLFQDFYNEIPPVFTFFGMYYGILVEKPVAVYDLLDYFLTDCFTRSLI